MIVVDTYEQFQLAYGTVCWLVVRWMHGGSQRVCLGPVVGCRRRP